MYKLILSTAMLAALSLSPTAGAMICGDYTGNGQVEIGDLVFLVDAMFNQGQWPIYPPIADCDGDGNIDIADVVCWVSWMFGGGPAPQCPFRPWENSETFYAGCVYGQSGLRLLDKLRTVVVGNDIWVYHDSAYYQCCLDYSVEYVISDSVITGFERDLGDPCNCLCYFNLKSVVYDLPPGTYTLVLIGIAGDTVGADLVVIPDGSIVVEYGDGGCQPEKAAYDPPIINYRLTGDTLTMEHENAYLNCAAIIVVDFAQGGDTLRFYELNFNDFTPVPCMCYFVVWANAVGIAPGTYVAELYQQAYPWSPVNLLDRRTLDLD